jgi:hypothetical protein
VEGEENDGCKKACTVRKLLGSKKRRERREE